MQPLTVVIVTYRRPDSLARTLHSLAHADQPSEPARTLVVETGIRSGAEAIVTGAPKRLNAEYRFVKSGRKSDALNTAIEQCNDDLLIFLDDDVRVAAGLLNAYATAATEWGPGRYFGGPAGVDYDVGPPHWLKRYLPPSAKGHLNDFAGDEIKFPRAFLGFNWAAYASDLRACGGFSVNFGPGTAIGIGDESFMQLQLNRRGVDGRFVPKAIVWHHVPVARCTPEWALARAPNQGLIDGIRTEWHARSTGRKLRPWWRLARQLRCRTQCIDLMWFALGRHRGIFWARHTTRRLHGFWTGMRQGAAQRPLDADVWTSNGLPN